jgi:hypothetical protein
VGSPNRLQGLPLGGRQYPENYLPSRRGQTGANLHRVRRGERRLARDGVRFRAMGGNLAAALQIAQEGYETTLDALAPLTDDDLEVERPYWGGGRMPTGDLFLMLAEHDVYHAGQIIYIRGMYAAQKGK